MIVYFHEHALRMCAKAPMSIVVMSRPTPVKSPFVGWGIGAYLVPGYRKRYSC